MLLGQPVTGLTLGFGGLSWRMPVLIPLAFPLQVAGTGAPGFAPAPTANFCQVGNAGIQITVQVLDQNDNPLNVSGATSLVIALQAPDGTQSAKTAQYVTNGIDGQLFYATLTTDITEAGLWYVQAQVVVGGSTLTTQWGQFEASANL